LYNKTATWRREVVKSSLQSRTDKPRRNKKSEAGGGIPEKLPEKKGARRNMPDTKGGLCEKSRGGEGISNLGRQLNHQSDLDMPKQGDMIGVLITWKKEFWPDEEDDQKFEEL